MTKKRILKPHGEQECAVYLRVLRVPLKDGNRYAKGYVPGPDYFLPTRSGQGVVVSYNDNLKPARTISSVKVETAVETAEYIKLCLSEGLDVKVWSSGDTGASPTGQWWLIEKDFPGSGHRRDPVGFGSPTLREAYGRYHQAAR